MWLSVPCGPTAVRTNRGRPGRTADGTVLVEHGPPHRFSSGERPNVQTSGVCQTSDVCFQLSQADVESWKWAPRKHPPLDEQNEHSPITCARRALYDVRSFFSTSWQKPGEDHTKHSGSVALSRDPPIPYTNDPWRSDPKAVVVATLETAVVVATLSPPFWKTHLIRPVLPAVQKGHHLLLAPRSGRFFFVPESRGR